MNVIKNNTWFINENELAITIGSFYVSINLVKEDEKNIFLLKVSYATTGKEMALKFNTLEKAVVFAEDVVSRYNTFDEIKTIYLDTLYQRNKVYRK